MLLWQYSTLILKQFIRIRMAFFFTLIFPLVLYLIYGHANNPFLLIAFLNFAMQSAMLQSVGMFIAAQKSSPWGQYVMTLPAPKIYPAVSTILAMLIMGMGGIFLIAASDVVFYHTLSLTSLGLALMAAAIGAIPMGALGYLLGSWLDPLTVRNVLTLANMAFLFITFVPISAQKILAWVSLPNAWLAFSLNLALRQQLNVANLVVLTLYSLLFVVLVNCSSRPARKYLQA